MFRENNFEINETLLTALIDELIEEYTSFYPNSSQFEAFTKTQDLVEDRYYAHLMKLIPKEHND